MQFTDAEIRGFLKFSLVRGKFAWETFRKIKDVLGDGIIPLQTARNGFRDSEQVKTTLWINQPTGDLWRQIRIISWGSLSYTGMYHLVTSLRKQKLVNKPVWSISRRLDIKKLDVWVPHNFKQKNLLYRINAYDMLLKWDEGDLSMKQIVPGNEKRITHDNFNW